MKSPKRPQHLVHWLEAPRTKQGVEFWRKKYIKEYFDGIMTISLDLGFLSVTTVF